MLTIDFQFAAARRPALRLCLAAGLFTLFAALGCASTAVQGTGDTGPLAQAKARIERKQYREAVLLLTGFLGENPGNRYLDQATFLLGQAYYGEKLYPEAESKFRDVLGNFPDSEFAPEASFHLALSLLAQSRGPELDQTETLTAEAQFESFARRYPDHPLAPEAQRHVVEIREKLARKEFLNARTYERRHCEAAEIYYLEQKVIDLYPETRTAPEAMYRLFVIYRQRHERMAGGDALEQALSWGRRLLERDPEYVRAEEVRRFLEDNGVPMAADSTGSH